MCRDPQLQRTMRARAQQMEDEPQATSAYFEAVVMETLRLKPAAPFMAVQTTRDVDLGGLRIPGGTGLIVLNRPGGLHAESFADAGAFRPERWLERGSEPGPEHGSSPPIWPDHPLVLTQIRSVLMMLSRHFEVVQAAPDRAARLPQAAAMAPTGLRARFHARTQATPKAGRVGWIERANPDPRDPGNRERSRWQELY